MLNRVSDLLHAVDREARVLDVAEARALRNEIEGHLDAAIMARLELGATPEEAEREAVAAFGDVRRIVRALRPDEGLRWFDRHFFVRVGLGWLSLFAAGLLGAWFFAAISGVVNVIVLVLALALVALVVVESLRARRVQLLPVLALFPVFALLGAIGQAATTLPQQDLEPAISRAAAQDGIKEMRGRIDEFEGALANLKARRAEFDRGVNIAPAIRSLDSSEIAYGPVASRSEATHQWSMADDWRVQAAVIVGGSRSQMESLQQRLNAPWIFSTFGWLGISTWIASVPAALTLLLNALVAFITWLIRRLPRRGQTI